MDKYKTEAEIVQAKANIERLEYEEEAAREGRNLIIYILSILW
jgi:hypothetical protein